MLHLYWKIKFWLLGIEIRSHEASYLIPLEKQQALESRLDFLIFEALYAAHLSSRLNLLIPLTNALLVLRVQHEVIKEKHSDFYKHHSSAFKMIEDLGRQLDLDQLLLTRKYENNFKDPLPQDIVVRRLRLYVDEMAGMYGMLYDGSFDEDCVEIMTLDQKSFYEKDFIPLQMETLSKSA